MRSKGTGIVRATMLTGALVLAACGGEGSPFDRETAALFFRTERTPDGGAGRLYNVPLEVGRDGNAPRADRFEIDGGSLPPGVRLVADREDADGDGLPDPDAPFNGDARLIGFPRETGSFTFDVKAIATGALDGQAGDGPAITVSREFTVTIGEGSITVLTPTAAEGTADSAVPAFPEFVDFVNPANPQAFFSWPFLVAGGSGENILNAYLPRELELSVFDTSVADGTDALSVDSDESPVSGSRFEVAIEDGGWFVLQAGSDKVQVGGFQSPRGPVGTLTSHAGGPGLDPVWFQRTPADGGPARNSRRDFADTLGLAGGDPTLGAPQPVLFSDYFDPLYEGTHPDFTDPPGGPSLQRRKYPFPAEQYDNAFFVDFTPGVDLTPLRYRAIVEAIDTRGTQDKADDVIDRKAFIVNVRIPDIKIDTVMLPAGQAGVDYGEFVNASGGVPPLSFDLEWVDGSPDLEATAGDALTRQAFGIDLDESSGQFLGVPRAAGGVDLTVVVSAAVMNPVQSGPGFVPTGTEGEFAGVHPLTGKAGVHKTFTVDFALPTAPRLTNTSLAAGVDGVGYPGDRLVGAGGVPRLIPDPVDFEGSFPSSTALRTYGWEASYIRDASYGADAGTVDPDRALPRDLVLDGDPASGTNGSISGTPNDRGFHPVRITQTDAYLGLAFAPDPDANRQVAVAQRALSVSPDSALYLRGLQASEGLGGEPTGLLEPGTQAGEPRMVPMMLASTLFRTETGSQPATVENLPAQFDLLPIMIPNGGSDAHNRKSIPSITGFWPAESSSESDWGRESESRAWHHLQQEMVWLQSPGPAHRRVFLWGETRAKTFNSSASSGAFSKRYQQFDDDGQRGVMVVDPISGDFWMPAVLDNDDPDHGSQFGADVVLGRRQTTADSDFRFGNGYWKSQDRIGDTRGDRELLGQGLGSYLENTGSLNTGGGWYKVPQGRSAVSVAMSADGTWCATALPGGDGQKILMWRTDRQALPAALVSRPYVETVDGVDSDGSTLLDSAAVVRLGGETTVQGTTLTDDDRHILADSLLFVEGGLVFLNATQLDHVFGFNLVDGSLTSLDLNVDRTQVNGAGTGPTVEADTGQYVPDQDYVRGLQATPAFGAQWAFVGNEPSDGAEGPSRLAFVAGENFAFEIYTDLPDATRPGFASQGALERSLMFVDLDPQAGGLDLGNADLRDLTGSDRDVYGDLLTPGRPGEELDYLTMSDDGEFVAVVRDISTESNTWRSSYATTSTGGTNSWEPNNDLLVVSTQGLDMDGATSGDQHVLFVGSKSFNSNTSTAPSGMPSYASGEAYLNARYRRINGLHFSADGESLIFNYAADDSRTPLYYGLNSQGWAINPSQTGTFGFGTQASVRLQVRDDGAAIDFGSTSPVSNALTGIQGVPAGPTGSRFGSTASSDQLLWATFKSADGNFLYYVSDQLTGRNLILGLNISAEAIGGHDPFEPFTPHGANVGFEQIDVNSFNYENRFFAVPGGVTNPFSGRDGAGLVFVIGSDASASATSATDLEVFVFDANVGGDLHVLTSDVTDGTANAINHLYASADGNFLVGQRSRTSANSRGSRATLNGRSDLFAITNVHAVIASGATPDAFVLSADSSHGSSVAFVGEGTAAGPQALVYSRGESGGNTTWSRRTLRVGLLQESAPASTLDSTSSHYAVLSASRRLDDDPADAD